MQELGWGMERGRRFFGTDFGAPRFGPKKGFKNRALRFGPPTAPL